MRLESWVLLFQWYYNIILAQQTIETVGFGLLLVINKFLSTGSFPNRIKHAVTPYLKT